VIDLCDLGVVNGPDFIAWANSLSGSNVDATRLHRFRQFELKLDLEQAIVKAGTRYLDIIGKVEAPLERTAGYATIKVLAFVLVLVGGTRNDEHVLVDGYVYLLWSKASDRQCNAIGVFAGPRDVAGRVVILRFVPKGVIDKVEKAVEADACPPEGI